MYRPILIADSGGTKTDWCYIDENREKHFFSSESYHPSNWSDQFEERINLFWNKYSNYKLAKLHFFCAGCLKIEKANELVAIFKKLGFTDVSVKSDLHAAGLSLYGNTNGNVAILGTGSVYFEWNDCEVLSIKGGKGFEIGDEGSGFYFGKLLFTAYRENKLTTQQRQIFEKNVNISEIENNLNHNKFKELYSKIPDQLKSFKSEFSNFHKENARLFFESINIENKPLFVRIVGGYFAAHSEILIPYLSINNIEIVKFMKRPIDSLVDYLVGLSE